VSEARLKKTESGLTPATDGWFVMNVRDAAWQTHAFGDACFFENPQSPFDQLGISVRVLWPGRSTWLYHSESAQEDFLVLSGDALLLIGEQERPLRAWDFVHCPPGTAHGFLALGQRPCIIVMIGARPTPHTYRYPRSAVAIRHGIAAHVETSSPTEALAPFGEWQPGPTAPLDGLPWSNHAPPHETRSTR